MASPLTEALAAIQPVDRAHECTDACGNRHKPVEKSKRRSAKSKAPHTRIGPQRGADGLDVLWHTTKPRPWVTRQRNRARARAQRLARKANR